MPIPIALKAIVRTRQFWFDFLWCSETVAEYPELANQRVEFHLPGGFVLALSLDKHLSYFSLGFMAPGSEEVEIGWDDQAHWHPHVLRWEELENLCRLISLEDLDYPHPGTTLLLLHRFAPICVNDDIGVIVPMLEAAWRQVGVFTDHDILSFIERIDARTSGFCWQPNGSDNTWRLSQDEVAEKQGKSLYTLRSPESDEFPHLPWNEMIESVRKLLGQYQGIACQAASVFAENGGLQLAQELCVAINAAGHDAIAFLGEQVQLPRACWVTEMLLGKPLGAVLKKHVRGTLQPRKTHSLYLSLPLQDSRRPLPDAAGYFLKVTLDRLLTALNLGSADSSGSSSQQSKDGSMVTVEQQLYVAIKGDLDRGLALIREALWWIGAPESVRLRHGFTDDVPLHLSEGPNAAAEAWLQLANLRAVHWTFGKEKYYRLDRVALSDSCLATIRSALSDVEARGPDEAGWYHATFPDHGALAVHVPTSGDVSAPDTVVAVFQQLSPLGAGFVHRLAKECGLLVLPLALTTTPPAAGGVDAPWPRFRIVSSPTAFHELLARGPYLRWLDS